MQKEGGGDVVVAVLVVKRGHHIVTLVRRQRVGQHVVLPVALLPVLERGVCAVEELGRLEEIKKKCHDICCSLLWREKGVTGEATG